MIYIGNHVSVSKGYLAMGRHESSLGGNTFAFFPRNPRGGTHLPMISLRSGSIFPTIISASSLCTARTR